ncbi:MULTISPECIES: proton-conducting transporter membrane subunit [unclassified Roseitalea]|uniref:complex I subunit 5 family protein n=1 Tax=unclassified Roseitalea TaxID=2639107 RepID=UPI00273E4533|nr:MULTISPECIES: proton-conducting transporter membrane subunit [unclassified Roseitalea]
MILPALAPALSVAVPLAAAFLAVVAPRPRLLVGVTVPAMLAVMALAVLGVRQGGPLVLAVGGWEPPLGIALVADGLSTAFLVATALTIGTVLVVALPQFPIRQNETRAGWAFWPLAFLLWAALNAVFLSGDLFNIYVAIEFVTLATLALVALEGKAKQVEAAMRYAMFALFGSLAYLLGVALLYAAHGTLDIGLLAQLPAQDTASLVAAGLITAGLAAKTALFPFHAWLPPAHAGAPAPASAMLSALVPKASFYVLLRFWFDAMPEAAGAIALQLLGALGATAIVYGSILAVRQNRLKQLVAYSTVAQIGYLFLVFPLAGGSAEPQPWTAGAWTGSVFHAVSHAFAKAAMFLAVGHAVLAAGHDRMSAMDGLTRRMPMTAFALGVSAVTLMGLPPSGGFTAKFLLLTAAFASGQVLWAAIIVLGGVLAAAYLFRPLARAFLPDRGRYGTVPRAQQALPLALAMLSVVLGIVSAAPYDFLQTGRPAAAEEGLE